MLNDGRIEFDGPPQELTRRVAGRSYRLVGIRQDRRGVLAEALDLAGVRDGVIQGDAVRVVLTSMPIWKRYARSRHVAAELSKVRRSASKTHSSICSVAGRADAPRSPRKWMSIDHGGEVAVSCKQLTKRFGDFTAAENVTFDVAQGEIFGLLGPNGAGKSTTFKMLCGLLKPTSGEALVGGLDLSRAPSAAKERLGYMSQKFALYGLMSVRQNLEFYSGVYGLTGALRRERIDEMIETFELQRYLKESPDTLPLGFKQRLALACALMHRPRVLFLDEPTSGVDPITRREFWTHINGLARKGVTAMVTTHFMDEAEYCDRVALMHQAKVIALGSPDDLKERVVSRELPDPSMEDAFISLVERAENAARDAA